MSPTAITTASGLLGGLAAWFAVAAFAAEPPTPPIRLAACRIKPANQVTLSVNQSGILGNVPEEGDEVREGQKIVMLEDDLPQTALAIAEREADNDVDMRYSVIASDVARLEYEQGLKVNETVKGSLTNSDTMRRKLEYDRSVLQIEQAEYKRTIAILKRDEVAAQLKTFHAVAPFSGTVIKVLKHKGEAVRPGDPVVELVNTRRIRVEGHLDVAHRHRVMPGTRVAVAPEGRPGEALAAARPGTIVFVDKVVQPVTRQVRIWADVDNADDLLLPGLTAVMMISGEPETLPADR